MLFSSQPKCNFQNNIFAFSLSLKKRISVSELAFFLIKNLNFQSAQIKHFTRLKTIFYLHSISSDILDRTSPCIPWNQRQILQSSIVFLQTILNELMPVFSCLGRYQNFIIADNFFRNSL